MVPVPVQPQPSIDAALAQVVPDITPKKKSYLPWLLGILVLVIVFAISFLILTGKSKSTPANSLTQLSVPPEQTAIDAANIDMSSWKTYINEVRGFEFKYPNNLEIYSNMGMDYSDDSIYLYSKSEKFPYCGVQSISKKIAAEEENLGNMKASSLKELIDNSYKQAIEDQYTLKRVVQPVQEGIFAGKKMYKYVVEEEGMYMIWGSGVKKRSIYTVLALEHNDSYIMIGCGDNNVYNQILSTFKFIDTTAVSTDVPIAINDPELTKFVREYLKLSSEAQIGIEKIEGNYAYGSGGAKDGAGFYWAAAKKDGQWNYAFGGNGIPDCSEVEIFPVGTFKNAAGGKFDVCYNSQVDLIDRRTGLPVK